jgi:hypothetical protein
VHIIVVVSVDVEGVDGLVLGYFLDVYGWREVPFAHSISSKVAFVGWRVEERLIASA